uniref:Uncharacterized protein n=1 Tax=Arundo donax TaxID=35708 RepID=A0A0A9CFL6_ARUDO
MMLQKQVIGLRSWFRATW